MSPPQPSAGPSGVNWLGRRLELLVGPVAHGGHCVARHEGRVVFVRHALPGESVLAEVTEDRGKSFCRADAMQVLTAAPDRVTPPCPYAHPGGCGGCDFQHVSLPAQRELKAAVVTEQFSRLAGLELAITVLPLADSGLGWRRRIRFAVGADGMPGLRVHRSHRVIPIQACPIGAPGVGDTDVLGRSWPGFTDVEVATDDRGEGTVLGYRPQPPVIHQPVRPGRAGGRPDRRRSRTHAQQWQPSAEQLSGPAELQYRVAGRDFAVQPAGFWQTHPRAAEVFTESVLAAAGLQPGDRALDLYAGAGLFTAALAGAVTASGVVLGLEADRLAVGAARRNLADLGWAEVRHAAVSAESVAAALDSLGEVSAVVLDPPRTGAGAEVTRAVLAAGAPTVIYVACDPAALARDVRTALDEGWQLAGLSAYDAFPMTHHVECIAVLRR